jgi:transposase-like protein
VGFFQFLRNFHQLTAFEQAEMILYAALDPAIASRVRQGDFVKCLDHFNLLQTARNWATDRQVEGTVEADDLYHTAGQKGQAKRGGKKPLGRRPRGRRKKREPGRGHYDKDRPAIIAWVSRQGGVIVQATRDFTVKTVQKAADIAVQAGSRLYTDSASSYRDLKGYLHDYVNHTKKEYARGEVHENRAECLFSLLKPYLRVFRGISKMNLPGYVSFFQFLRNFRCQNAFEQTELILWAALDPAIASRARRGEFVKSLDHFDLLQTAINWAKWVALLGQRGSIRPRNPIRACTEKR